MAVKFIFPILPELHLLDLAGPCQVIQAAIGFGADFEIEYCSLSNPVSTSAGLPFGKLLHFSEIKIKKDDFIIVAGTSTAYLTSDEFQSELKFHDWLYNSYSMGVNICSICTGAFALGCAGLLDGIKCTTHFSRTKLLQKSFRQAYVQENILFTEEEGIYTSAGISSGIDLTLQIVENLKGSYFAHQVARELVVYNRRNANHKQTSELLEFRNHMHSGIHKVQDWLQQNLHKRTSIIELANIANMSDRNFTRVFKRETGITVKKYVTLLRKEKIGQLSKNPDLSKSQIARKCGLTSERQLFRIINRELAA